MRLTPEEMRGRVVGVLRTLMQSTPPVGGALAGVLLGGPAVALPLLVMSGVMAVPGFVGLVTPGLARDGGESVPAGRYRLCRSPSRWTPPGRTIWSKGGASSLPTLAVEGSVTRGRRWP